MQLCNVCVGRFSLCRRLELECSCCVMKQMPGDSSAATYFLVVRSWYKKMLLVWWCVSTIARTRGFTLNELEFTHDVAVVKFLSHYECSRFFCMLRGNLRTLCGLFMLLRPAFLAIFSSCAFVCSEGNDSLLAYTNLIMLRQSTHACCYLGTPLSAVAVMIVQSTLPVCFSTQSVSVLVICFLACVSFTIASQSTSVWCCLGEPLSIAALMTGQSLLFFVVVCNPGLF